MSESDSIAAKAVRPLLNVDQPQTLLITQLIEYNTFAHGG
jgi:hypothetical protein